MDIVHGADLEWSEGEEKHREGRLSFKNIFKGTPGTPENYRLVLTRNNGPYRSPRHHHNFDQVRFCLEGKLNIAPGVDIEAGDAGYFPEGAFYGPQDDGDTKRLSLTLQFGGASGSGYMSSEQLKAGPFGAGETRKIRGWRLPFWGQPAQTGRLRGDLGACLQALHGVPRAALSGSHPFQNRELLVVACSPGRATEAAWDIHRTRNPTRNNSRRARCVGHAWCAERPSPYLCPERRRDLRSGTPQTIFGGPDRTRRDRRHPWSGIVGGFRDFASAALAF